MYNPRHSHGHGNGYDDSDDEDEFADLGDLDVSALEELEATETAYLSQHPTPQRAPALPLLHHANKPSIHSQQAGVDSSAVVVAELNAQVQQLEREQMQKNGEITILRGKLDAESAQVRTLRDQLAAVKAEALAEKQQRDKEHSREREQLQVQLQFSMLEQAASTINASAPAPPVHRPSVRTDASFYATEEVMMVENNAEDSLLADSSRQTYQPTSKTARRQATMRRIQKLKYM
ncbi:hypothetical protein THASP1DRAFT_30128 [Thamnocephalis sphaerospora]|uniref:Uncharacterized protein n=1 Tax=Thamnocephalis sphaerospora TaxID=78915 RepID=A0A4P9XPW5_9FUNG|nr:hypothetical protein THASP1DRAFT_30128 [Thamnocephalis sphaerospora]|eukprot:RKP08063.1 hypothetical protein THASP1DRAFT_30128 [Thamnocephalis sphaerospora]